MQHDGDASKREDDLGEDAEDVGNRIHRWPSLLHAKFGDCRLRQYADTAE